MIQIVAGEMGKGKTKELLRMVNEAVLDAKGSIVYLDKSNKHMYELSNKVRLINVKDYVTKSSDEFIGFIYGILSQDNDLEKIYVDSLLKVGKIEENELKAVLEELESISNQFSIDIIVSISLNQNKIPESLQKAIVLSL